MEIQAKVEYGKLKKLVKAMSDEVSVKVGLLAKQGGSDPVSENIDLAGLGAVQEFGAHIPVTDKMRGFFRYHFGINLKKDTTQIDIPARSFLQMPLERKNELLKRLKEHGFKNFDDLIDHITETGDYESLGYILGGVALEQIQEAFDTSGWGEWAPNSELTISNKIKSERQRATAKPLIDTGRLKDKITFEVNNNG